MRFLLAASILSLTLPSCALSSDEDVGGAAAGLTTDPGGPVKVSVDKLGARFTDWGFDIKQACAHGAPADCKPPVAKQLAEAPAYAQEIFGKGQMRVLRIPIRADAKGVDESGHFKPDYYEVVVKAAKNALAANKDVKIFASRNTVSDCPGATIYPYVSCDDFAASLKQDDSPSGAVLMWKYGRMLSEYLAYMDSQGVHVAVLGIENEPHNNEGNLTIERIADAVSSLEKNYALARTKLMLNDAPSPDLAFLKSVDAAGKWNLVGYAGTHYQSDERSTRHDALDAFAAFAHQNSREVWDTEFHYTDQTELGEYADAALGLYGAFDQFDAGVTGIVWWGFKPRSEGTAKAQIQSALVETTAGAWPLPTDDGDGPASSRGKLTSRAFRQGKDAVVWVVNDTDKDFTNKQIELAHAGGSRVKVTQKPTFEQWHRVSNSGALQRVTGNGGIASDTKNAVASYPEHSITVVRIEGVYR